MHLKSLTLKGFKSFPDRTRLEFSPGVSVVVGPNGSGKSNITDAVVWAMGEQSPSTVRGQSMQDVIFGGGAGVASRNAAEVELVIDNSDGSLGSEFSEISILRRLDRSGEGEYRINGARCRMVDVLEILSDTGLGKEMHSVVSQGKVDEIVNSKPRERRLLIEEAAGLGKHRKRRRRAQLKLERTQDNLDRALDVEREARSRLKPLKRQAEAAETHERLQRQQWEARAEIVADDALVARGALKKAQQDALAARDQRGTVEADLKQVGAKRAQSESQLAERAHTREELARRSFAALSASDRIQMRLDGIRATAAALHDSIVRNSEELSELDDATPAQTNAGRIQQLRLQLDEIAETGKARLETELAGLRAETAAAADAVAEREQQRTQRQAALQTAEAALQELHAARKAKRPEAEAAHAAVGQINGELAAVSQLIRALTPSVAYSSLAEQIIVSSGYERAVAAVLGARMRAGVAANLGEAGELLDRSSRDGGLVLLKGARRSAAPASPCAGAQALCEQVSGAAEAAEVARELLADAWLVSDLKSVPSAFAGVAVTSSGRVWWPSAGELRQAAEGGQERVLEARNRRDQLIVQLEQAVQAEATVREWLGESNVAIAEAEAAVEQAIAALREATRLRDDAIEIVRTLERRLKERSREDAVKATDAVRRAELQTELKGELSQIERAKQEETRRRRRRHQLDWLLARDRSLAPVTDHLAELLLTAGEMARDALSRFEAELEADRDSGEAVATRLRECAAREGELQIALHRASETVTGAEVHAERARDTANAAAAELGELARRLEIELEVAGERLSEERRQELHGKVERLQRRREQLGPVNPLAKQEYAEAIEHVEALESQRVDLEAALKELDRLIGEIDRTIKTAFEQTFASTAAHFEEVVQRLFPGGSGDLRLVRNEDLAPKPALIGSDVVPEQVEEAAEAEAAAAAAASAEAEGYGVELEVALPGKTTKRLSLLSGGEKTLIALAFVFAVFLTRPCPFYILDEAEAALDDINIDRFLTMLREYSDHSQFIVVTHQKRTMDAADCLYGVSMGRDGVSKVVTRRLASASDEYGGRQETLQPA